MHGVPEGRLTRVELGRSRPPGETPAQQNPRSMRRARRLPAPVLGAFTFALVVAASWPATASAGIRGTSPGPVAPEPTRTAQPWLLGRTAPALVVRPTARPVPAVTD